MWSNELIWGVRGLVGSESGVGERLGEGGDWARETGAVAETASRMAGDWQLVRE